MKITRAFITTVVVAGIAGGLSLSRPASAAEASPVVALAAGDEHTCALHDDGTVQCWGSNDFGQLGTEDVAGSTTPVPVQLPADTQAVAIAAGGFHTCALTRDHRVFCWGYNGWGSIGIGDMPSQTIPALVALAPSEAVASDITAGGFTTCVSMSNGTAQCWGRNQYGEVGDATRTLRNTPTPVIGVTDAVDIDAGTNHVCVLRSVGRAQCWGRASDGRTGDPLFGNVAEVSAGGAHTCMRTTVGGLRCWGANTFGQLTPNDIDAGIARVSTGGAHTCAATEAGIVRCWGEGTFGQLGLSPVVVDGRIVRETAAGTRHTCALLDDASVWCWGDSTAGQAGDHSLTLAAAPVNLIAGVPPVPTTQAPVGGPSDSAVVEPQPVEKQAASSPSGVPASASVEVVPPAASAQPAPVAKRGVLELRLGRQAGVVRLARAVGVRLPGTLIASSMSRARSMSVQPLARLRVEMSVSHPRNCRNVLTATLGAAVRATRVGECRVTLRISRAGRPDIVRTVLVQTVSMAATVTNPARGTR